MEMSMRKKWTYEEETLIERAYHQDSYWWCSKWEYLAEQFGVTTAQLKNHVDYMVKKGVLKKERKVREKRVNPNFVSILHKCDYNAKNMEEVREIISFNST